MAQNLHKKYPTIQPDVIDMMFEALGGVYTKTEEALLEMLIDQEEAKPPDITPTPNISAPTTNTSKKHEIQKPAISKPIATPLDLPQDTAVLSVNSSGVAKPREKKLLFTRRKSLEERTRISRQKSDSPASTYLPSSRGNSVHASTKGSSATGTAPANKATTDGTEAKDTKTALKFLTSDSLTNNLSSISTSGVDGFKVILLRGLPGSGKSTLAEKIKTEYDALNINCTICSADQFFVNPKTGKYEYSVHKIGQAHEACMKKFLKSLEQFPVSNPDQPNIIIIDNTNIQLYHMQLYATNTVKHQYKLQILLPEKVPETESQFKKLAKRNIHGVHVKKIRDYAYNFRPLNSADELIDMYATSFLPKPKPVEKPKMPEKLTESDLDPSQADYAINKLKIIADQIEINQQENEKIESLKEQEVINLLSGTAIDEPNLPKSKELKGNSQGLSPFVKPKDPTPKVATTTFDAYKFTVPLSSKELPELGQLGNSVPEPTKSVEEIFSNLHTSADFEAMQNLDIQSSSQFVKTDWEASPTKWSEDFNSETTEHPAALPSSLEPSPTKKMHAVPEKSVSEISEPSMVVETRAGEAGDPLRRFEKLSGDLNNCEGIWLI